MKTKAMLIISIFCLPFFVQGSVEFGFRTGLNLTQFYSSEYKLEYTGKQSPDLVLGIDLNFLSYKKNPAGSRFSLRTGLVYLQQKNIYETQIPEETDTLRQKIVISNLRIPLIFEVKLVDLNKLEFSLYTGGYLGYIGFVKNTLLNPTYVEQFKKVKVEENKLEYGLSVGTRVRLKLKKGKIVLDIGYNFSLNDIENHLLLLSNHRSRGFLLTVGYQFAKK